MSMTVKEMAEKYYPKQWNAARLEALVDAGRMSREDAGAVINSAALEAENIEAKVEEECPAYEVDEQADAKMSSADEPNTEDIDSANE